MANYFGLLSLILFLSACSGSQKSTTIPAEKESVPEVIAPSKPEVKISKFWDANELNNFISNKNTEITECYENVKIKVPDLDGWVKLRIKLNPGGFVEDIQVVEDSLGSQDLLSCITGKIKKWKTPVVETDKPVWLDIPYEFMPLTAKSGTETIRTREEIIEFCSQQQGSLSSCFDLDNAIDRSKVYTFGVNFNILPDGKVTDVVVTNSSIQNESVELCLTNKVKLFQLRSLQSDKMQPFSINFSFKF
ncbi:MAG: AgmX/PglI C-terminal domain-containing protein [Bacteroidetes bacterium]|nr:AgmX/PglI C-terminal domain-containing protein [Bacteroidota bacterium]